MIDPKALSDVLKMRTDFDRFMKQRQKDTGDDGYVIALLARIGIKYGAPLMLASLITLPDQTMNLVSVFKGFDVWPTEELEKFLTDPNLAEFTATQMKTLGRHCIDLQQDEFLQVAEDLQSALD